MKRLALWRCNVLRPSFAEILHPISLPPLNPFCVIEPNQPRPKTNWTNIEFTNARVIENMARKSMNNVVLDRSEPIFQSPS